MTANEIREKYLKFFEDRGHVRISPSPLVLENDPTTLFTSSGMQQLVPYLKGEPHPKGKRLVDSQPSLRLQDIKEVGDRSHTTFFEMLGNWSLGDYFKAEQLPWIWEFFTKELGLPKDRLWVSVFEGTKDVPKDTESIEIWKTLGVPEEKIKAYGVDKNWWSRSGTPEEMPVGEIGGPDSEVFYEFDIPHNPKFGEACHPNCQCGRFLEIGNSVFMQYKKNEDGTLSELPQKNVDFGGGLERIVAASENQPDIFKTSLFSPVMERMETEIVGPAHEDRKRIEGMRIIVDHIRASVFLIKDGVLPSNKMQGYVLRRLLRRAAVKMTQLGGGTSFHLPWLSEVAWSVIRQYDGTDYFKNIEKGAIEGVMSEEMAKFGKAMDKGLKIIADIDQISGKLAFDLYQTYGFPVEVTEELFAEKGQKIDKKEIEKEFEKHKELSRASSASMFKAK